MDRPDEAVGAAMKLSSGTRCKRKPNDYLYAGGLVGQNAGEWSEFCRSVIIYRLIFMAFIKY
jgi:hypothetical protein